MRTIYPHEMNKVLFEISERLPFPTEGTAAETL